MRRPSSLPHARGASAAQIESIRRAPIRVGAILGAILLTTSAGASPTAGSDWNRAQDAFAAKRWEEAVAALERVLERTPDLADSQRAHAHFLLGLSLSELGQGDRGLEEVRAATELDRETPQYSLHLAKLLLGAGRAGEALDALAEPPAAALRPPLDAPFAALLAKASVESHDPAAAQRVLRAAIEGFEGRPAAAPLWRAIARIAADEDPGRAFEAALGAFELVGAPDDARRAIEIATAAAAGSSEAERLQWSQRAAEAADRLLATAESDAELPLLAGRLRLQARQPELARPLLELAVRRAPTSADPVYELARCAHALGDDDSALAHLDLAVERASSPEQSREAWALRASLLHEQGRLREAIDSYRRAGRAEQAERLESAADARDQASRDLERCRDLRFELEKALAEAQGVTGPRELNELRARAARRLEEAGCAPTDG